MADTATDHVRRINRTLSYIDDHLGDRLDLRALASIACFSRFHFHRVFKRVAGVSPQEYVKRRRLEMAHHFLSNDSTLSVNQVADLLGFSSPSNFARAFRGRYAFPPRQLKTPSVYPFPSEQAVEGVQPFAFIDPSLVRLEILEPLRVFFVRTRGSPSDPATVEPVLMGLRAEAERRGLAMAGARMVVIGRSIPGLSAPEQELFDMGLEIPPEAVVGDLDEVQTVPGGAYARYDHRGDPSMIVKCWAEMYGVWLKRSGLSVGSGFGFTMIPGGPPPPGEPPTFRLYQPIREKHGH